MTEYNSPADNQSDELDQGLQTLFAQAGSTAEPQPSPVFTEKVMRQVDRSYRRAIMWRIASGVALFLIAIPLQDVAMALTELLVIELVDIPNQLMSDLLMPINSVGAVVSLSLLGVRLTQKRLLNRLAVS